MTTATPIATLAGAIAHMRHRMERLNGKRERAEARFAALAAPTVAEALADPSALAAHELARCISGLTAAAGAQEAVEEAIGSLEAAVLATPATGLADLATKAAVLERLAEGDSVIETADLAGLFADVRRIAEPP